MVIDDAGMKRLTPPEAAAVFITWCEARGGRVTIDGDVITAIVNARDYDVGEMTPEVFRLVLTTYADELAAILRAPRTTH